MKASNILVSMKLAGQVRRAPHAEAGYAMAALLVALSVMAILMTAVMPVWKQSAQREKEEELIFRGQQYTHALTLFSRKYANAAPPNLDVLVEQRFLRRKYKDPITNSDFQLILAGQNPSGSTPQTGRGQPQEAGAGRQGTPSPVGVSPSGGRGTSQIGTPGAGGVGGILGVSSKSKDKSIRLYNGRSRYNEWAFVVSQQLQGPGGGAPGSNVPGQPGRGRGQQQPGQTTNPFGVTRPGPQGARPGGSGGPAGPGAQGQPGRPNSPGPPPPPRPPR
jgi:type II secretory pathway pseudopilin PulG